MDFSNKLSFTITFFICIFLHNNPLKSDGVTVDLIPRDISKSHFDRLKIALERSSQRLKHFSSVLPNNLGGSKIQTKIIRGGGSYIMNVSLGTPPVTLLGIADTGSELVWTQCLPCTNCYKQNLPFYNPKKSSTYKKLSCNSNACSTLQQASCDRSTSTCTYAYLYGDQSRTFGDLSSETFRVGNSKSGNFKNVVFGCAHDSAGTFDSSASGLIGLSPAALSLVSQLDEKKFSYCLQPFSSKASSKISFGSDGSVRGSGVAKTPLQSQNQKTFYFLTLEGVSVGRKRIKFQGSNIGDEGGNIIIDSGTTLTYLPTDFYTEVTSAVEKAISADTVPSKEGLSPCYSASDKIKVDFTVHFRGGDVKLSPGNLFVQVDEETVCFILTDAGSNIPIYGNIIQTNFLVGYDLDAGSVSFLRKDCTKKA